MNGTLIPIVAAAASCICAASSFAQSVERREPQPQVRYRVGPDTRSNPNSPQGRLEGPFLFHSKIIENTVRKYWVFVPAQYDGSKPACLLVFQDGARATNPDGPLRVHEVLENLIAKEEIPLTIGVFITPGHRGTEYPDSIGFGNPDNRDREYDVLNDTYARFLIDELLPEIGKQYKLTDDPRGRAIGGSSSGAICAFTVAWERPDYFQNVISLIGSYTNIHGGHVYPDLVRESAKKPIRIFLQDGVNDLRSPADPTRDWYLQNLKMIAALQEKGYDMASIIGEGGHSDDHGGAILPHMLRWIWRDYPGVKKPSVDPIEAAKQVKPEMVDLFPGFDPTAKIDVSGTYTWQTDMRGIAMTHKLVLEASNGQIKGRYSYTIGDDSMETEILQPELIGNKLVFDAITRNRQRESLSSFHGIVGNDGIKGWRVVDMNGQIRDVAWNATRQAN